MKNDLEKRILAIEIRNSRVEENKAWETSWVRRVAVMFLTYMVIVIYLKYVVEIDPWVNALVPVIGYVLSTLTIGVIKRLWLRYLRKS